MNLAGGGYPDPVNGVILVASETEYTGGPGRFLVAGFRFDAIGSNSGTLKHLATPPTAYVAYDGVQWNEDQETADGSTYAIRARGESYSGPAGANVFQFNAGGFVYDLSTTYLGTFTPWGRMSLSNNDVKVGERSGNPGTSVGVATIEIGPWPTGGAAYMAAVYTMTYNQP